MSEVRCAINQQLVVFAIDGLTSQASTSKYMPKTHAMAEHGLYTPHMRTTHDTARTAVAWIPVFYASSTSEYGCDNNGCDSIPRMFDEMPNWVDILEEEEDFAVSVFSQDKRVIDEVLDRNSWGYPIKTLDMQEAIVNFVFPDVPKQLVVVHLSGLNRLGEVSKYDSFNYNAFAGCIDNSIDVIARALWELCPEGTTFVLTSNHGGHGYQHTDFVLDVVQVPFMMWGHHVASGVHVDGQSLQTVQIGPTIMDVLGYLGDLPVFWIDRQITDIKPTGGDPDGITFDTLPPPVEEKTIPCQVPISVSNKVTSAIVQIIRGVFIASTAAFAIFFSIL